MADLTNTVSDFDYDSRLGTFSDLPTEIRLMIWHECLQNGIGITPVLLRLSSIFYEELTYVLYSHDMTIVIHPRLDGNDTWLIRVQSQNLGYSEDFRPDYLGSGDSPACQNQRKRKGDFAAIPFHQFRALTIKIFAPEWRDSSQSLKVFVLMVWICDRLERHDDQTISNLNVQLCNNIENRASWTNDTILRRPLFESGSYNAGYLRRILYKRTASLVSDFPRDARALHCAFHGLVFHQITTSTMYGEHVLLPLHRLKVLGPICISINVSSDDDLPFFSARGVRQIDTTIMSSDSGQREEMRALENAVIMTLDAQVDMVSGNGADMLRLHRFENCTADYFSTMLRRILGDEHQRPCDLPLQYRASGVMQLDLRHLALLSHCPDYEITDRDRKLYPDHGPELCELQPMVCRAYNQQGIEEFYGKGYFYRVFRGGLSAANKIWYFKIATPIKIYKRFPGKDEVAGLR